jgi:hypothetical protein
VLLLGLEEIIRDAKEFNLVDQKANLFHHFTRGAFSG